MVTLVRVAYEFPELKIPPPSPSALLPETVLLITVRLPASPPPSLSIAPPAPPDPTLFPVNVQSLMVKSPLLKMAPPTDARPLVNVKFEIETLLPFSILKMRLALFPLIVNDTLGPVMVRSLSMTISPPVNVIGLVTPLKVIDVPGHASAIAWRREPAPLSAFVVTTCVAPQTVNVVASAPLVLGSSVCVLA